MRHLLNHPNHPDIPPFHIRNTKGFPNLEAAIGLEIKAPGRIVVGILADANTYPDRRWQAIADRLRKANFEPPAALDRDGTVIEGTRRVGIWLMPDNWLPGELEDFIKELIPADDRVWPRAQIVYRRYPRGGPQVLGRQDPESQDSRVARRTEGAAEDGRRHRCR